MSSQVWSQKEGNINKKTLLSQCYVSHISISENLIILDKQKVILKIDVRKLLNAKDSFETL